MKTSPLLLCLDIGSSACKGLLIDETGRVVASCRERYTLLHEGAFVEQDPETLWTAARKCLAELAGKSEGRIAAISLGAQMSSHMLVNREDRPLTRFISWSDRRAEKESAAMAERFSPEEMTRELGASLKIGPSWPFPRLKWWRDRQPALLDRARYLVQPKDWVLWKMCGVWKSDLSSLRGFAHQETGEVSPVLLKWTGAPDLCPPISEADAIAGTIHKMLAQECGLPPETPVVLGWNDLAAAVLGSTGMPDEAIGFDITGTSEHLGICQPHVRGSITSHPLALVPLGPRHELRYGVTSSSGLALEWYLEKFRGKGIGVESYRELETEIGSVQPGSNGLLFLPSLNGERAPWFNPQARGVLYGLTPTHTPAEMSRAVLEGITFLLRSIQQRLGGAKPERLYVSGGASAMASWNQLKADVLGVPLVTLEISEAGCLGAAILAARALGWHSSLAAAGRAMIRPERTFEPDSKLGELYAARHSRFEKLHQALEPVFAEEQL